MGKVNLPDSAFDRVKSGYSTSEEIHIHRCLTRLISSAPKPRRIVEMFSGLGAITDLVCGLLPGVPILAHDIDARCVEVLQSKGYQAIQSDSIKSVSVQPGDGVLIDHNMWTIKRMKQYPLREFIVRILVGSPLWVQINDCAVGKLPMNYKLYGCKDRTLGEYLSKYDEFLKATGYIVSDYEGHARATQILLSR